METTWYLSPGSLFSSLRANLSNSIDSIWTTSSVGKFVLSYNALKSITSESDAYLLGPYSDRRAEVHRLKIENQALRIKGDLLLGNRSLQCYRLEDIIHHLNKLDKIAPIYQHQKQFYAETISVLNNYLKCENIN